MKVAVVAVTKRGAETGQRIMKGLSAQGAALYVPEKWQAEGAVAFASSLRDLMPELFARYEGLVFVMAAGIVVRMIAPYLRGKQYDPAVVVVDECGQHAISLLSGHWGGANALAEQVGISIGARPVITTATDVQGKLAFDVLARQYGLKIYSFAGVKVVNSAIVNGQEVLLFSDYAFPFPWPAGIRETGWEEINAAEGVPKVYITNRKVREDPQVLVLSPASVYVGIGCRRGIAKEAVLSAIQQGLQEAGRDLRAVQRIISVDIKRNETGLLEAAGELQIPLSFLSPEELRKAEGYKFSGFVYQQIGVGGVCEPAVLRAGGDVRMVLPKRIYSGVTVAVGEEKSLSLASGPEI